MCYFCIPRNASDLSFYMPITEHIKAFSVHKMFINKIRADASCLHMPPSASLSYNKIREKWKKYIYKYFLTFF